MDAKKTFMMQMIIFRTLAVIWIIWGVCIAVAVIRCF